MYSQSVNFAILVLAFLIGLVAQTEAHGFMIAPPMRFQHGTQEEKLKMASDPTKEGPCGASGYGPVTTYKPGEEMLFVFNTTITHPGDCYVEYSTYGDKEEEFHELMNLGECGMYTGLTAAFVKLPEEECHEKCVVRFKWDDDLGNNYRNCADIVIMAEDKHMRRRRKARRSLKF